MTPRLSLDDAGKEVTDPATLCACGHELCDHGDYDNQPCSECNCLRFRMAEADFDDREEDE